MYGITETTNKDRTIISGYIECMPGDQLQIQHANELSMSEAQEIQDDLDISTYVDGEKIAGTVYPRELEDFYTSDDRLQEVKGHRDAPVSVTATLSSVELASASLSCTRPLITS